MAEANNESNQAPSQFLLLFRNAGEETHKHLNEDEKDDLTRQWNAWFQRLMAEGKMADGRPLGLGGRVVSGTQGQRITDGPFAEAKEVVGGYFILNVTDIDEATRIAQQCPGLPLGLVVEVRPIQASSPVLKGVRGGAAPDSPTGLR